MNEVERCVNSSRREFLKISIGATAIAGFPAIVPSVVFGKTAPSNRINVGAIGVGRISRVHDLPGIWQFDQARIIAVCDLDSNRVDEGKALVNDFYTKKAGKDYVGVTGYHNYHDLLANKDIDAVVISTPDHQHAILAVDAVHAGKDVYLQKPASLTIAEGRAMSNAVMASGRILQVGSQQRSWKQFHRACELVRNGRIGEIKHVEIGLPGDPSGPDAPQMPIPSTRRLRARKSCSSCLALAPSSAALLELGVVDGRERAQRGQWRFDRRCLRVGGSAEPVVSIDLPPLRIAPENASWRDFWSSSNFDVFTDEIEKSTMKRQNRSVIMSAKDTSQRSSFSCSSSWCPPFLWRL